MTVAVQGFELNNKESTRGLEGISLQFARKRTHTKNFKVYTAVQPMPDAS